MKLEDIQLEDGSSHPYTDLAKLVNKKIANIVGFIQNPFNEKPIFTVSAILFEDGSRLDLAFREEYYTDAIFIKVEEDQVANFPTINDDNFKDLFYQGHPGFGGE